MCGVLAAATLLATAAGAPAYPELDAAARVKQHRAGAAGALVAGEEEQRKLIISWKRFEAATGYEVCHGCDVDANGVRTSAFGEVRGRLGEN